jgi:protoheme IX farnesyltransferase
MEKRTRSYLQLMKPGITLSNTIATIAGFLLAASSQAALFGSFVAVTIGEALIIASACVVNNMIDRGLDARMKRTKKREIVQGSISLKDAAIYAAVLGIVGFSILFAGTNTLTFALGVIAYLWYVVIYGLAKRRTSLSTIIGGVAGALPPVTGYVAVTGRLDMAAVLLFLMFSVWQISHFYAIAIFRREEYKSAGLPVWSVVYGNKKAKYQIMFFVVVFALIAPVLSVFEYTGYIYAAVMGLGGLYWITRGIKGYRDDDYEAWARRMFGTSLIVLLGMCFMIAIGGYLP